MITNHFHLIIIIIIFNPRVNLIIIFLNFFLILIFSLMFLKISVHFLIIHLVRFHQNLIMLLLNHHHHHLHYFYYYYIDYYLLEIIFFIFPFQLFFIILHLPLPQLPPSFSSLTSSQSSFYFPFIFPYTFPITISSFLTTLIFLIFLIPRQHQTNSPFIIF